MKKLLVLVVVLGMFVFVACAEEPDPNTGGGVTDGPVVETLESSLITIAVDPKDLGTLPAGSQKSVKVTFTNKDTINETVLRSTGYRNSYFNGSIADKTCSISMDSNTNKIIITLPAGGTCEYTQKLNITSTTEGSPYVMYFEDANKEKLAVVISYTVQ